MNFVVYLLLLLGLFLAPADGGDHDARTHQGMDVLHYRFALTLSDASDEIQGEARIRLQFTAPEVKEITLDLQGPTADGRGMRVESVEGGGGKALAYRHEGDRLRITLAAPRRRGAADSVVVRYHGIPADGLIISKNQHGARTFFGDNWPNRARHWLPTVDHPNDKATVEFVVTAPAPYQVVSNGAPILETAGDARGRRVSLWRSAAPLPTKVIVIGAARFVVEARPPVGGIPRANYVFPEDREKGLRGFAPTDSILAYFVRRLGPYPFERLANVQSKTRYGGMENAGAIFYPEAVVAEGTPEDLLAHEIAHQWFGNAVTETDWRHVWLSEGFATFLEEHYLEHRYGPEVHRRRMDEARSLVVRYMKQHPGAVVVDSTYAQPEEVLQPLTYQKGAWVLEMLRYEVGEAAFWKGLRAYYAAFRDGNASSADFEAAMERASGQDLTEFFRQWLYAPGYPVLDARWRYDAARGRVEMTVRQAQAPWPLYRFPLEIGLGAPGALRTERVEVRAAEHTFTFEAAAPPQTVVLDPGGKLLMLQRIAAE